MLPAERLGRALASSYAIPALLRIHMEPGIGLTALTDAIDANRATGAPLKARLVEAGLVKVRQRAGPVRGKLAYELFLTPAGQRVVRMLIEAAEDLERSAQRS